MSESTSEQMATATFKSFGELVEFYRPRVHKQILEYMPMKEPKQHYIIARDYVERQGKYARPGLLLTSGLFFGAKPDDLILPAAAQQLSEDWILMQDDAEDDSDTRRGKPAIQKLYGWVHSVNASNVGQVAMWKMLKDYAMRNGAMGSKLYDKFYEMIMTTAEGQYIENQFIHHTKDLEQATEKMYFDIIYSKTCFYTVYGPLQLGAIVANQPDWVLEFLKNVGTEAGRAFQIVDDVLDYIADEKAFGKANFGDVYEGKITIPVLHAYKNATKEEKAKMNAIFRKTRDQKTKEEVMWIFDLEKKYGSLDYAMDMANGYGARAEQMVKDNLDKLPKNEYTDVFLNAIRAMYVRKK